MRSTPTPKLIFLTLNVARDPLPPLRAITTPSYVWMRSRSPSMTRTWTRTVSPDEKSGRSSRSCAASISSIVFTGSSEEKGRGAWSRDSTPAAVLFTSLEVGPAHGGSFLTLTGAPLLDSGVIARQQHVGNVPTTEVRGPRVYRLLKQIAAETLGRR